MEEEDDDGGCLPEKGTNRRKEGRDETREAWQHGSMAGAGIEFH